MRIHALPLAAFAIASLCQSPARAQNDLVLNNGVDVLFIYSDPSHGAPTGTFPPDTGGDLYWKVYPREALLSASGALTLSGMGFFVYDTDWSTPPPYYDALIALGKPSSTTPGNIEPDFGDPGAIFVSLGQSNLPDPCTIDPSLCGGNPCPAPGFVLGWEIELGFGSGSAGLLQLLADGQHDYTITHFIPGGMMLTTGPSGSCGLGDYALEDAVSSDETQADVLSGDSAYGGFSIGGLGLPLLPDSVNISSWHVLEFQEPIIQARVDPGTNAPEVGLASLRLDVGSATAKYGYTVYDYAGIGNMAIATASVLAPLAPPGILFNGAHVLLDPSDHVLQRLRKVGTVVGVDHLYGPPPQRSVDDGVFESSLIALSWQSAGLVLSSQAIVFDAAGLTAQSTQVFATRLYP